jgi:hypothetical protein
MSSFLKDDIFTLILNTCIVKVLSLDYQTLKMKKKFENIENSEVTDNSVNIELKNKGGDNVLNVTINTDKKKLKLLTSAPFQSSILKAGKRLCKRFTIYYLVDKVF